MKAKEIDLERFHSIDELNQFLESHYLDLDSRIEHPKFLAKFRDFTQNLIEKEKAQFEIDYALFHFKGQDFFPLLCNLTGKAEKVCEYDNLTEAAKCEFDYLLERAENSKNAILKAHYYHVLWKCPSKLRRKEFGQNAIEYYYQGVNLVLKKLDTGENEDLLYLVGHQFECLLSLVNGIKGVFNPLEELFKFILKVQVNIPFYQKHSIITEALNYPKLFSRLSYEFALEVYEIEFFVKEKTDERFLNIEFYIPNALKLSKKLNKDAKPWHLILGKFHLDHALGENDKSRNWVRQDSLRLAINNFKMAGNSDMIEKAETLFRESREYVDLPSHRIEYTREKNKEIFQFRDSQIAVANKMIETGASDPIFFRWLNGMDFPFAKYFDEISDSLVPDFLRGCRTIFFDINNNPREGNDKLDNQVMKMNFYKIELDIKTLPFLDTLIREGIKSDVLSAEKLLLFLQKNTWLGRPYYILDSEQKEYKLSWISLITPSVTEYFSQRMKLIEDPNYQTDFILCIDSLAVKIEGLLRYFLEQCGYSVTVVSDNKASQMTLNKLIESEGFKKLFNLDDQLFFEYLFGGIGGLDIRNNVAHAFYHSPSYSSDKMMMLISALLRIAKYKLVEKKK